MVVTPLILQPDSEPYGANRALLRTIEAMPEGCVRPVVVFPYEGAALAEYEAAGCEVHVRELAVLRRSSAGPRGLMQLARDRKRTGQELATLAQDRGCNFVHTNSMTIVSGTVAAKTAGIPHVWQLREAPRERGMKARILGILLIQADLVVAVSRAAAELVPKGQALVVYDGFDLPMRTMGMPQFQLAERGVLQIGMLGRISPSKAPHVAVEALGAMKSRGDATSRLAIAGTVYMGYEEYAEREVLGAITRLDLTDRVDILGWLDDPEPLYEQLDVLVIATATGEGFPGSVLEAMAHGIPVVSAATGGVDELVLHEKTGLRCAPGDADEVALALERIRDDADLRHAMQDAAREHAGRWSVQASADRLLEAWESVLP